MKLLYDATLRKLWFPHIQKAAEAALVGKNPDKILRDKLDSSMPIAVWKEIGITLVQMTKDELEDFIEFLQNGEHEVVKMQPCKYCESFINGEAKSIVVDGKTEFAHIFCGPDTQKNKGDNTMSTKKTTTKKAAPVPKAASTKSTAKPKTGTPKKTETKSTDGLFRDGSKYAFVYGQLKKGITFAGLQKILKEKFGDNTAKSQNVKIYIATIGKKTTVELKGETYHAK